MKDEEKRTTTTTLTLRDKRWYYKGEGNVNVVLAVPADGTVLRVMKDDGAGDDGAAAAAAALSLLVRYRVAVGRLFFAHGDYTDVPAPATVSADELRDVDERVRRDRPPGRLHKGLGWAGGLVAVCPDHTVMGPSSSRGTAAPRVYCVELKPKRGWSHEADAAAAGRCAFCAHQYLKLGRGDVREISRYCPLDLFSGRRGRARRAVRRLFRTPQNNLKVFADGVPVDERDFGRTAREAFGDVRRLSAFVAAVLLGAGYGDGTTAEGDCEGTTAEGDCEGTTAEGDCEGTTAEGDCEDPTTDDDDEDPTTEEDDDDGPSRAERPPCDFDAVPMPTHCVLHKILAMQKMQTAGFADVCSAYDRSRGAEQFGHVDRLSAADRPERVSRCPVDGYLVAATAHDCSVFVTFARAALDRPRAQRVVRFDGRRYAVRVKVSDLDPKPLSTVEKHRERNANVLLAYERLSAGRRASDGA